MTHLITAQECENLTIDEIWKLYAEYVNPAQVEILSKFSWGRDVISRAEGMYLYTRDGRRILDFTGGIGVLDHGHNHPRILAARRAYQDKRRMEIHKVIFSPYLAALSHNIAQLLPGDLNKSFFPNSGAEAVEGALKLAFKSHQARRDYVLFADIAFHGKLIGSGSISGLPQKYFEFPRMENTASFKYGDLESVTAAVAKLRKPNGESNVYGIIIEPFHASTATPCSADFLYGLRELCNRNGIVLIFDEVYMGWGKSGTLFYFMRHEGLVPDVLVMSKSFGGGKSSISAYTARDPVFRRAYGSVDAGLVHTSTYNGFGEECATALEAIQVVIDDDHPGRARRIHNKLVPMLMRLQQVYPKDIKELRGVGAFNSLILSSPFEMAENILKAFPVGPLKNKASYLNKVTAAAVAEALYRDHAILAHIIENRDVVMLGAAPSVIAEDEHLEYYIDSLDKVLAEGLGRVVSHFTAKTLARMALSSGR